MSERGVFAVDRGIFDHPMFADEPFTEREAWIWLVGEAAWRPTKVRVGKAQVALQRGQLAHSLRFMAAKWGWQEPRVRRFLNRLKTDAMVDAAVDAGVTVLTICKYNEYQRVSLPADAARDALPDAVATQQRRREEDREYREGSTPASLGARTREATKGSRLPEDFEPSAEDAKAEGLPASEVRREVERFRDYYRAAPGQKGVRLNWPSTWRNWCKKAVDDRKARRPPSRAGPSNGYARAFRDAFGLDETPDPDDHHDPGKTLDLRPARPS